MQQADGQVLIRAEMDISSVTAGIAEMRSALDALQTYAARQFASIRTQVQTEGSTLGSWMPGLASRLIGALSSGLSGGGGRITDALRGALASAWDGSNAYTARFSSIGSYVISGIISGIQGSASALWSTLREVASNMLNTLKASLGIRSPSQIMREEIGQQIGAGIAEGMLDSQGAIASASETLAGEAVVQTSRIHMEQTRGETVDAAGFLLRTAAAVPASVSSAAPVISGVSTAGGHSTAEAKTAPVLGGNTFIFQKPVETPYRHAQAIREVMEEMLYGT